MLTLVLCMSLGQLLPATPPTQQPPERSWEPPPEPPPANTAPKEAVTPPPPEPDEPNPEAPPPGYMQQKRQGPSRFTRAAASTGGGVLGGVAALGVSYSIGAIRAANSPNSTPLDISFANAALAAVMIAGVGFTVQHAMGGYGEVIFALFGSIAVMACAAAVAQAIDPTGANVPWLTTAIGSLPASALSVVLLEVSTPEKTSISMSAGPGSLLVRF